MTERLQKLFGGLRPLLDRSHAVSDDRESRFTTLVRAGKAGSDRASLPLPHSPILAPKRIQRPWGGVGVRTLPRTGTDLLDST